MSELPSKLFFRIGEVAGLVGVEPHVLRYWEREFRSIRPTKSAKGQRVYSRKDVENLLRVRDLLYRDGFTIAGAKKQLQRGGVESLDGPASSAPPPSSTSIPAGLRAGPQASNDSSGNPATGPTREAFDAPTGATALAATVGSGWSAASAAEVVASAGGAGTFATCDAPEPPLREKLTALRAEVETFLAELTARSLDGLEALDTRDARDSRRDLRDVKVSSGGQAR